MMDGSGQKATSSGRLNVTRRFAASLARQLGPSREPGRGARRRLEGLTKMGRGSKIPNGSRVETWTETCGPYPGGILTTQVARREIFICVFRTVTLLRHCQWLGVVDCVPGGFSFLSTPFKQRVLIFDILQERIQILFSVGFPNVRCFHTKGGSLKRRGEQRSALQSCTRNIP